MLQDEQLARKPDPLQFFGGPKDGDPCASLTSEYQHALAGQLHRYTPGLTWRGHRAMVYRGLVEQAA